MSFDEEGDHYMSKADFALMCDELKKAVSQRDELLVALKVAEKILVEQESALRHMGCNEPNAEPAILQARDAIANAGLTQ